MKRRMSRREFAALAASGATAALATGFRRGPERSRPSASRRAGKPNIVMVLLDDLHSSVLDRMPQIKTQLGAKGTTYEAMVNAVPICGPSRCAILRGQYARNTGIHINEESWEIYRERSYAKNDVATWMAAAGYRTGYFGKYINNYEGRSPRYGSWERWHAYNSGGMGWSSVNDQGRVRRMSPKNADPTMSGAALEWISASARKRNPFFAWVSFGAPHKSYYHDREDANAFRKVRAPRSPEFNEADVSDKPRHIRRLPRLTRKEIARIDEQYRDSVRSCLRADDFVGRLVKGLSRTGQLQNTYIFLYSDNGNHFGEHRLEPGKNAPYRTDTGNPLLVRGPGIGRGKVSKKTIESVDLAPTFVDLAGGENADFVDGRSIFTDELRLYGYSEHPRLQGGIPAWRAAKDPASRTLYVEYETGEKEYYENDLYEIKNRPQDAPADIVAFLEARKTPGSGSPKRP